MNAPLDKLHDFYQPAPPAWTPQTVGWYVVFVIAGLLISWMIVHNVRKWLSRVKSDDRLRVTTLYFIEGNTLLSPTLILLDEFWASIKGRYPGDVLIAVPRRDQLFIFNDNAEGPALARRMIDVTFKDNLNLLSDRIYARRNGKIVAVEG